MTLVEFAREEERRKKMRAYYEANRERLAAQQKARREANKERIAAKDKEYREANKTRRAAKSKEYREANKDAMAARHRAYREANKDSEAMRQNAWRKANKARNAATARAWELEKKYGLSMEAFEAMCTGQDHRCKCCGIKFGLIKEVIPCVDHCHRTGRIRGIVCYHCNLLIGHAHDSSTVLKRCARYLDRADREANHMTPSQLLRSVSKTPFRPFRVRLADGREFVCDDPSHWCVARSGACLLVAMARAGFHEIDSRLIVEIVALDVERPAGSIAPNPHGGKGSP